MAIFPSQNLTFLLLKTLLRTALNRLLLMRNISRCVSLSVLQTRKCSCNLLVQLPARERPNRISATTHGTAPVCGRTLTTHNLLLYEALGHESSHVWATSLIQLLLRVRNGGAPSMNRITFVTDSDANRKSRRNLPFVPMTHGHKWTVSP